MAPAPQTSAIGGAAARVLIQTWIERIADQADQDAWLHFERIRGTSRILRLLRRGYGAWVELAWQSPELLALNVGRQRVSVDLPDSWPKDERGVTLVPKGEGMRLAEWIATQLGIHLDDCTAEVRVDYRA